MQSIGCQHQQHRADSMYTVHKATTQLRCRGIKPSLATSITAATMGDSAWDGTPRQSAWGGPPVGDGAEPGLQDTRERITTAPVIPATPQHPRLPFSGTQMGGNTIEIM